MVEKEVPKARRVRRTPAPPVIKKDEEPKYTHGLPRLSDRPVTKAPPKDDARRGMSSVKVGKAGWAAKQAAKKAAEPTPFDTRYQDSKKAKHVKYFDPRYLDSKKAKHVKHAQSRGG